jgi:hypothetical protein
MTIENQVIALEHARSAVRCIIEELEDALGPSNAFPATMPLLQAREAMEPMLKRRKGAEVTR